MTFIDGAVEVLEYYEEDVDNDNYGHIKEQHLADLLEDEDALESAETRYENRKDESQHKKKIRTTIMAAFLRNGVIERITQWEFKKLFPLRTLDVNSADVLIGNQTDGAVIFVVILPLRQRPETGIEASLEFFRDIRANNSTLSRDIDLDVNNDRIKSAIALEPARANDTAAAIEEYEGNNSPVEEFYIWRISGTEGEKIDLYSDFPTSPREERVHDGELGEVLSEGREILDSPHVLPDFFYDSHHSLVLENTITKMGSIRRESEIPNTHFSRQELRRYFEETLHGSDASHKASTLASRVITLWNHLDVISEVADSSDHIRDESTTYRFNSRKQNPKSIFDDILEDYKKKTIEFLLEVHAMEEAIDQFQNDRGIQADFAAFRS